MRHTLILMGEIPSKKNRMVPGRRGLHLPREIKASIDFLQLQANQQWSGPPVEHPDLTFRITAPSQRMDANNLVQTLFDVIQHAGVISNDNIAHCNGRIVIEPVQLGTWRSDIDVEWAET